MPLHEAMPPTDEIMTSRTLPHLLKCKSSSIYNMTRRRGRQRYDHPIPVLRLPCGCGSRGHLFLRGWTHRRLPRHNECPYRHFQVIAPVALICHPELASRAVHPLR